MKDLWNSYQPWSESKFKQYYTSPILAAVINKLYKLGAPETGRDDLVAVLLTGVPKLNYTGAKLADVLRLNLSIPVTANPNRMGVLAGDNQGWPNGRRLGDDVIDIAEQAVGGFLKGTKLPLGDGVNADDQKLQAAFPYVADPQSGFANTKGCRGRNADGRGAVPPHPDRTALSNARTATSDWEGDVVKTSARRRTNSLPAAPLRWRCSRGTLRWRFGESPSAGSTAVRRRRRSRRALSPGSLRGAHRP